MRLIPIMVIGAMAALFTSQAEASDILEACSADIEQRCADVNPGNGRLQACLYAYEDQLGEACGTATADAADVLDLVFERLRFVKQECGADIQQFCGEVELGEGRIFSCLSSRKAELSESCSTAIGDVKLPDS